MMHIEERSCWWGLSTHIPSTLSLWTATPTHITRADLVDPQPYLQRAETLRRRIEQARTKEEAQACAQEFEALWRRLALDLITPEA